MFNGDIGSWCGSENPGLLVLLLGGEECSGPHPEWGGTVTPDGGESLTTCSPAPSPGIPANKACDRSFKTYTPSLLLSISQLPHFVMANDLYLHEIKSQNDEINYKNYI